MHTHTHKHIHAHTHTRTHIYTLTFNHSEELSREETNLSKHLSRELRRQLLQQLQQQLHCDVQSGRDASDAYRLSQQKPGTVLDSFLIHNYRFFSVFDGVTFLINLDPGKTQTNQTGINLVKTVVIPSLFPLFSGPRIVKTKNTRTLNNEGTLY